VTEDPAQKRTTPRVDVTLKVALQYPDRDTFVERFSINVSKTGLFIRARDPAPVGSRVRFEYRLKDETRILRGTGIVRWARPAAQAKEPDAPPGMGIEFVDLDPQSEELVTQIVASHGEGERAPRKAVTRAVPRSAEAGSAPARPMPELDAEEEELLSGLELGDAPPPQALPPETTANNDPLAALDAASAMEDPLAALEALVGEPIPPAPPPEAVPRTVASKPAVDVAAPHVVIDLAGPCILASLVQDTDRFDERKLELTVAIRDGKLVLGQAAGVPTRALYAWADTKPSLRTRLAAEAYGLTLTHDPSGRPMVNVEGTSLALIDLALAAMKYTLDAYREQLAKTSSFRIIVPATISASVRAELTALAKNAQLIDDVALLAGGRDNALVIAFTDFETRIARVSGQTVTQLQVSDGLADLDTLVCQATARALLKEHGIDTDDDPSLRDALFKQVHLARKDSAVDWDVSIAGASITMSQDAVLKALEPALRRIALAAGTSGPTVLASDEPLWSGIADRLKTLLGDIDVIDASAWLRIAA
jgi:uncharacterized protein (TIGR02266 family)